MELTLHAAGTDTLEVVFADEDDTLLNYLKQHLLAHEDVDSASYLSGHPRLDDPTLTVEASGTEPSEAVLEAAASAREELEAFQDLLDEEAG